MRILGTWLDSNVFAEGSLAPPATCHLRVPRTDHTAQHNQHDHLTLSTTMLVAPLALYPTAL